MTTRIDVLIDVSDQLPVPPGTGITATIVLPEPDQMLVGDIVCFGFPGGGYSRHYYLSELNPAGAQADWHCRHGWVFVAVDTLGFGESASPESLSLSLDEIAYGNAIAVQAILDQLAAGTLHDDYGPIEPGVVLGVGQSMGGCFTIIQQAHHRSFDAIALLGSSALHTVVPTEPGQPAFPLPWLLRSSGLAAPRVLGPNPPPGRADLTQQSSLEPPVPAPHADPHVAPVSGPHPMKWAFHYGPALTPAAEIDCAVMDGHYEGPDPIWRSALAPMCGAQMVAPGVVATEAAAIAVPVFIGVGERDVVPDPRREPTAYLSATEVTVVITERMAHMHNFAESARDLWQRLDGWATTIVCS